MTRKPLTAARYNTTSLVASQHFVAQNQGLLTEWQVTTLLSTFDRISVHSYALFYKDKPRNSFLGGRNIWL